MMLGTTNIKLLFYVVGCSKTRILFTITFCLDDRTI